VHGPTGSHRGRQGPSGSWPHDRAAHPRHGRPGRRCPVRAPGSG
jgi:hypothetical protein